MVVLDFAFTVVTSAVGNGTVVTSGIGGVTEGIDIVASSGVTETVCVYVVVVAVVAGTGISGKMVDDSGGSGGGIELVEPLFRTQAWP